MSCASLKNRLVRANKHEKRVLGRAERQEKRREGGKEGGREGSEGGRVILISCTSFLRACVRKEIGDKEDRIGLPKAMLLGGATVPTGTDENLRRGGREGGREGGRHSEADDENASGHRKTVAPLDKVATPP
jgi:hypothetical protein